MNKKSLCSLSIVTREDKTHTATFTREQLLDVISDAIPSIPNDLNKVWIEWDNHEETLILRWNEIQTSESWPVKND